MNRVLIDRFACLFLCAIEQAATNQHGAGIVIVGATEWFDASENARTKAVVIVFLSWLVLGGALVWASRL